METSTALAFAAAGVHLSGYAAYLRRTFRGSARPNAATWILWVVLSALNCASYLIMSGDPAKSAIAFAGAAACTIVFVCALARGNLTRIGAGDAAALLFGLAAGAIWWLWKSAGDANLVLQAGFAVSMVPTAVAVVRSPRSEHPLPWFLWTGAYALSLAVVFLRWRGHCADLAYPCVNLVSCAAVGALACRR